MRPAGAVTHPRQGERRDDQEVVQHNYVPNEGLTPRDSGKYKRDSVVEWFVQQKDLLTLFIKGLKCNLRIKTCRWRKRLRS